VAARAFVRDRSETRMAIGPVQLLVLGFPQPDFHGEIIDELERLRQSDTVRVIDALAVFKDSQGELEAMHLSNLSEDEAVEVGSMVGALIGLGFDGEGRQGRRQVPRQRPTGSPPSPRRTRGTSSRTSRTAPLPPSSCSSTTGRSGSAMRSSAPVAAG
jgi:hypothetical protein